LKKLLVLLFLISQISYSQTTRKYSNEFLNIGVDAAAFGMAKAVVASSSDVNSGYWNPAGLVNVKDYQGSLMHASYFAGIAKYDYAAFAMPIDDDSAVALSIIRFGVDDILDTTELIDSDGNIDVLLCDGRYSSPIQLLVNDGQGNFSTRKYEGITTSDNTALTASDFDRDGDLDAVLQDGRYSSRLKLLRNDGRGNFSVENLLK